MSVYRKEPVRCPFEVNRGKSRYSCPSCGSTRLNFDASDGNSYDIYQCNECGTKFLVKRK